MRDRSKKKPITYYPDDLDYFVKDDKDEDFKIKKFMSRGSRKAKTPKKINFSKYDKVELLLLWKDLFKSKEPQVLIETEEGNRPEEEVYRVDKISNTNLDDFGAEF